MFPQCLWSCSPGFLFGSTGELCRLESLWVSQHPCLRCLTSKRWTFTFGPVSSSFSRQSSNTLQWTTSPRWRRWRNLRKESSRFPTTQPRLWHTTAVFTMILTFHLSLIFRPRPARHGRSRPQPRLLSRCPLRAQDSGRKDPTATWLTHIPESSFLLRIFSSTSYTGVSTHDYYGKDFLIIHCSPG